MEKEIKTIYRSDIMLDTSSFFRGTITIDGKRYIVKKERAIVEYLTSHLMKLMGIPVQKTSLAVLDGGLVVLCEDFTPKDMEFVPGFKLFNNLFPNENIRDIYDPVHLRMVFEKFLGDKSDEALSLIAYKSIFDCIVKEEDWGSGNWGILQGENPRLAPFYDNAMTIVQLMKAIDERSISLEKAIDYSLGEFWTPFISFVDGRIVAMDGFENIVNEELTRFKEAYTTESFCSIVKNTLSSVAQYVNIERTTGVFLYTALVLRYLHVIEGLEKNELLEIANNMPL